MAIKLDVTTEENGRSITLYFTQSLVILGRSRGSDAQLPSLDVSLVHAEIRSEKEGDFLTDKGSRNGTRLNGQSLIPGRRRVIRSGDRIAICGFEIAFRSGVAVPAEGFGACSREESALFYRHVAGVLGGKTDSRMSLAVLDGPEEGRTVTLPDPPAQISIGRGEACAIQVPDGSASKVHSVLTLDWDGVVIADQGSKNGTLVNGQKVQTQRLRDRDEIQIGGLHLAFQDPVAAYLEEVTTQSEKETLPYVPPPEIRAIAPDAAKAVPPPAPEPEPPPVERPRPPRKRPDDLMVILIGGAILALSMLLLALLFR